MKLQYKKYMIFLLGIAILTLGVSMTVKSDIGAGSYDSINFAIADILNTKVSLAISIDSFSGIDNNSVYKKRIYKNNNIYNICYNGIVYRCVG